MLDISKFCSSLVLSYGSFLSAVTADNYEALKIGLEV